MAKNYFFVVGTRIMKSKFCGNNFNFKLVELLNAQYEKYKNIDLIKAKLVLDILGMFHILFKSYFYECFAIIFLLHN